MTPTGLSDRNSTAPRLHSGLLDRPRLSNHARDLGRYRLVVVHAPAGSGKTSLLSQWAHALRADGQPVAWYAASDRHREHLPLADCLMHSLNRLDQPDNTTPSTRDEGADADMRLLARLRDAAGPAGGQIRLTLILDDFHLIEGDAETRTLTRILAAGFEHLTLVVAGRNRPALPLGRYRLAGELLELSSRELQFSEDEVQSFFRSGIGQDLSHEEARILQQSTEGWAAGLRLTSLIENAPNSSFLRSAPVGSQREYADYFLDEVIAGLPEQLCQFLELTSVLEALTPELCDAVTGQEGSAAILARIESDQLFLTEMAGAHRWYKYHQLFREFLQARLRARAPSELPALHLRASEWFIRANMPFDAVHHAFRANRPEQAAALIEGYCTFDYLSYGRFDTYSHWMAQLPRESREARPLLMFLMVWRYINLRQFLKAEQILQTLAQGHHDREPLDEAPEKTRMNITGRIDLMRALIGAYGGDMVAARRHIDAIPDDGLDALPFGQVDLLSIHAYVALHEGDLDRAERLTWRAHTIYDELGCHWGQVHSLCIAGISYLDRCRLADAERVLAMAMTIARQHFSDTSYMVALPSALQGQLAQMTGDAANAEALWLAALQSGNTQVPGLWERKLIPVVGLVRLYDQQGRDYEATTLLRRFHRAAIEEEDLRMEFRLSIEAADRALRVGDVSAAQDGLGRVLRQESDARLRFGPDIWQIWEPFGVLLARAARAGLLGGDPEGLLTTLSATAKIQGRTASQLFCRSVLAGLVAQPDHEIDRLRHDIRSVGLKEAVPLSCAAPPVPAAVAGAAEMRLPWRLRAAGITPREMEVLMLMRSGAPNHEIGLALGININTVKTHTKSIFAKLNVRNRTEAVVLITPLLKDAGALDLR